MIGFFREAVRILSLSCRDHSALASRELDEQLSPALRAVHRLHLAYCRDCAEFRRQIRRLRELSERIDGSGDFGDAMPGDVRERVIKRVALAAEKK
ncbi:MAG: hypothetical protein KF691_05455 [Phycisphaeraceae bacterium]|nr:hypothetical protein [Phycisphaeraceae bacterium]